MATAAGRNDSGDKSFVCVSLVFVSHSPRNKWQRLGYEGIRKVADALSEKTGIDFYTYRSRHTFATTSVLKGMNLYHVMTLTRHRSEQSFRCYTKATDQAAAEAAFYKIGSPTSLIGKEEPRESDQLNS